MIQRIISPNACEKASITRATRNFALAEQVQGFALCSCRPPFISRYCAVKIVNEHTKIRAIEAQKPHGSGALNLGRQVEILLMHTSSPTPAKQLNNVESSMRSSYASTENLKIFTLYKEDGLARGQVFLQSRIIILSHHVTATTRQQTLHIDPNVAMRTPSVLRGVGLNTTLTS